MKSRWLLTLISSIPLVAASVVLQSCAGVGGPTTNGGGGLPDATAAFLALLPDDQKGADYVGSDACMTCHNDVGSHWQDTQHEARGVGCERCHGPGSEHKAAMETDSAGPKLISTGASVAPAILTFPKVNDPVVCGQCHGPIHDQYGFSQHSKLVTSPIENSYNSPALYGRTSRCMGCHSGIFRSEIVEKGVDVAAMTDAQIQEIAQFTLNNVPHSANCSTCHDPHMQTGNLTAEGKEVQLRNKTFNTDTTLVDAGSPPSEFLSFDHSCGTCHNGRGANPSDLALSTGTSRPNMHDSNQYNMLMGFGGVEGTGPVERNTAHANAPGQCSKCHMPSARHTFTVSFDKGCAPCHTAADAAARAESAKSETLASLYALRTKMEAWARAKFGDGDFWDYTSMIQAEGKTPPDQTLVPAEMKRARHNYYFVIRSGDYGVHNAPYVKHLLTVANENVQAAIDALGAGVVVRPAAKLSNEQLLAIAEADRKRASKADMEETP